MLSLALHRSELPEDALLTPSLPELPGDALPARSLPEPPGDALPRPVPV